MGEQKKTGKIILVIAILLLVVLIIDFAIQYNIYNKMIEAINKSTRRLGLRDTQGSLSHFFKLYYAPFRSPYMLEYYNSNY